MLQEVMYRNNCRRSKGSCAPPPPLLLPQPFKRTSCFGTDIDCGNIGQQLHLVHDAVKTALPEVRQVTKIRTICEDLNKTPVTKTLRGELHKLLKLYLTLPMASATFELTYKE